MFKRGLIATYHKMGVKHLDRHVAKFPGQHNSHQRDTIDQIALLVQGMDGKQLPGYNLTKTAAVMLPPRPRTPITRAITKPMIQLLCLDTVFLWDSPDLDISLSKFVSRLANLVSRLAKSALVATCFSLSSIPASRSPVSSSATCVAAVTGSSFRHSLCDYSGILWRFCYRYGVESVGHFAP